MGNITFLPLLIGVGFLMMAMAFYMNGQTNHGTGFEKFDKIVARTSIILAIGLILSTLVRYDKESTMYVNENGYKVETGYYPNDTIPSSLMIYVDSTSVILSDTHFVTFSEGSWFFHVGRTADVNKFGIEVKKQKYLIGSRTYVDFWYDGKKLEQQYSKFH